MSPTPPGPTAAAAAAVRSPAPATCRPGRLRRFFLPFLPALLAALGLSIHLGVASATVCHGESVPAATLLLPYFEVNLDDPNGLTTLFSINNAAAAAVLTHVAIWSDLSVPLVNFNVYLTGYDVQTINLRDVIVYGNLPQTASAGQDTGDVVSPKGPLSQDVDFSSCQGLLPPPPLSSMELAHLRAALTGRPSPLLGGRCAGQALGDNVARGYITLDTVGNCTSRFPGDAGYFAANGAGDVTDQNVLWGGWTIVDAVQGFAEGSTLVAIEADGTNPATSTPGNYTFYGRYDGWSAVDHRAPLSTTFATQYATNGPFDPATDLLVWRDPKVPQAPFPCAAALGVPPWYPLAQEGIQYFNEQETVAVSQCQFNCPVVPIAFPASAQRTRVNGAALPVPFEFGWLYLDLNWANGAVAGPNPPADPRAAQAWVVMAQSSHAHFAVARDAFRLDSACTAHHLVPQ
jgi:hypothetical protein